jgi:hypothetical protein
LSKIQPPGEIPTTTGEKFTRLIRGVGYVHAVLLLVGLYLEPIVGVGVRIARVAIVDRGATMSVSEGGQRTVVNRNR